jgi:predicted nucleotidyltransferase
MSTGRPEVFPLSAFDLSRIERRWRREGAERTARSAERRRRLLVEGVAVLRRYGVRAAWLFGSVAEGTARQESDVDLLSIAVTASDYWGLRRDLEAVLGCPVDLYSQDDDPIFVRKVMDRGELIYEVQPGAVEGRH